MSDEEFKPVFTMADVKKMDDKFTKFLDSQDKTHPAIRLFELEYNQRCSVVGDKLAMEQGYSDADGYRAYLDNLGPRGDEELLKTPLGPDAHQAFMDLCQWARDQIDFIGKPVC